ncbi:hypothetical protein K4K97_09460 [Phaeobacter inhibens]|uniref:hypothetical protein n=1 Tax=Phaeobacter inhibens TaxID=221822 RepID=UPI0021A6F745|nr:hypothetical protein [Phaeobacter inhibens]UWR78861.1 hypothetical protein K4K97_09460 [Phaeobacter inhibens]
MSLDPKLLAFWVAFASLLWNLCNTVYARRIDAMTRERTTCLEEFRSTLRQPIEALLTEAQDIEISLESISASPTFTATLEEELVALNRRIGAFGRKLGKCLDDADRSKFSQANDWADLYYAKEDAVLDAMNTATRTDAGVTLSDRQEALMQTSRHLLALRRSIRGALEEQVTLISWR